ncbi:MAG: NusG domain II-containing protein [Lachnospiraceae bacterium]|nr:NusG domain II-containing protein [Lachnospiraceae bacterium]
MHRNGLDSTNLIKRQDIYLILLFLIIGLFAFLWVHFHKQAGAMVQVTVDGAVQGNYPLQQEQQIPITGDGWTNTILIKDGFANMITADCPDQICVKHTEISQIGETIVCLPHKVVVEIIGEDKNNQNEKEYDIIAN